MTTGNIKYNINRDVLAYVPVKIVPAVTGLLSIILLTRNLTPEGYANYSVAITTVLLLVQLSGTWISNSVLFFIPEENTPEGKFTLFRQTMNIQLLLAIPATVLTFVVINTITNKIQMAFTGSILVILQLTQSLMLTFLQSNRKISYQAIIVSTQCAFQVATLCWLILVNKGKESSAISSIIIGLIAGNLITIYFICQLPHRTKVKYKAISNELFIKIVKYGMPMCLWFFATQFYITGDRIILKYFGITEQLGQYSSFRDLATGCAGFLTMPLLMASHPIIMEKWKNKNPIEDTEKIISNNITILSVLFMPIIAATDIIGKDLITVLFGERYEMSKKIMILVIISIYLGAIAMHLQRGLEAAGKTFLMAKLALIVAAFFFTISVFSIPKYGVIGGAIAVMLSSCLYVIIVIISGRKILLPKIKAVFWLKLATWLLIVKLAIYLFECSFLDFHEKQGIFFIKALAIITATLVLFLTDKRFKTAIYEGLKRNA
jgi:O-antigen/teichoic acid export membrane protein